MEPGLSIFSPPLPASTRIARFDFPLRLACGQELPGFELAYETYGTLSAGKDNAVLICHALSGDAHVAGVDAATGREGWWDNFVGPGKGIDTGRYFVICSNVLGGCRGSTGPSSIDPATGTRYGRRFPVVTIGDMVEAQRHLLDFLGVDRLLAVVGGSMGGMQVLEWSVRFPERVVSAVAIATTARLSAQALAFDAVGRHAILSDPQYAEGDYYGAGPGGSVSGGPAVGLGIARMVGHITYLSEEGMHAKFGRALRNRSSYGYDFDREFSVETYLDHQQHKFVERFDANSYLYLTKAMDYFDLSDGGGAGGGGGLSNLSASLGRSQSRFLVVSFSSDWLFSPRQSRDIVSALVRANRDVSYCNIQSPYGHDAFLLEPDALGALVGGFLEATQKRVRGEGVRCGRGLGEAVEGGTSGATAGESRVDYETIVDLVRPGARVLDIGCGHGELLDLLIRLRGAQASGLELDQVAVTACVGRGITVRQADADEGLPQYCDDLFDDVVLSKTLQTVRRPDVVIREMLRIGRRAIVSFPNFAYWKVRLQLLLLGQSPTTASLPYGWYDSPNIHFLSLYDFEQFCRQQGAKVVERIGLHHSRRRRARFWPNLLSEEAVYVLTRA